MTFWTIIYLVKTFKLWRWILTATIWRKRGGLNQIRIKRTVEREKHNWFVTPLAPQGKRTPGLFKVEFKGDKMIGLCSKSYCKENFATDTTPGQVKFSMKGVNKGPFKNPMPHYEHVLNTKENFRACNSDRSKDQTMATYKQYKNV